jgi:hypothetical protein
VTIKFVCGCGKRLRARDELARRRTVCPRCGQPVGVPSGEPTRPGSAAAHLTPAERQRRDARRSDASDPAAPRDRVGAVMLALLPGRRTSGERRPGPAGERWYDYLAYPFREWQLWAGSAGLLTVLSVGGVLLVPLLLERGPLLFEGENNSATTRWVGCLVGLLAVWIAGYPCNFLRHVLRAAASGGGAEVRWPGAAVGPALAGALVWLGCFLAGPVVFAGLAAMYWVECGDPGVVDWLILAELTFLTVGYHLLVLAAVSEGGRLHDANPLRVIDLAHRLGWRAVAAALAGFVLAVGHGLLGVVAAEQLHQTPVLGALLLGAGWLSGLFWASCLFRLLGAWCHRTRSAILTVRPLS